MNPLTGLPVGFSGSGGGMNRAGTAAATERLRFTRLFWFDRQLLLHT